MVQYSRMRILYVLCLISGLWLSAHTSPLHAQSKEELWLTGTVLDVDTTRSMIQVDYEEIQPGLGSGPTWFTVSATVAPHIQKGHQIRGRLLQSSNQWRLENLAPYNIRNEKTLEIAATMLRRDTLTRGRHSERQVGERIPVFALLDQNGNLVQPTDFQGKYVVLNFIFSRCPQPDMCPAATARMIRLQNEARSGGVENIQLYSITLDPEYDTPYVLREYGLSRGASLDNFSFLTGPEEMVQDLLKQFGITTRDGNGTIDHTMSTVLIAPDGTILHKVAGSTWSVLDFLVRIQDHQQSAAPAAKTL